MAKSFEDLLKLAQSRGKKKLSVAVAEDEDVLLSVKAAKEYDIIEPILVGNSHRIKEIAKAIDLDLSGIEIVDERDMVQAARKATELVSANKAHILMK